MAWSSFRMAEHSESESILPPEPCLRGKRGVVLLEVLAAVAIIGLAGLALTELTTAGLRATVEARLRERQVADADRLLTAYTLLTRPELDQRLGNRTVGPYIVNIQRPERALYRIAVGDLITVVYRSDSTNAP